MAWQLHELQRDGKPVQWMLEDRFRNDLPGDELPRLMTIRVGFAQTPADYFWHPDESAEIDQIEDDLLRLANQHGDGWVVFVQRRTESGFMDYFFYAGETARLDRVVADLAASHAKQRFTIEETADPAWSHYSGWFTAVQEHAPDNHPDSGPAGDQRLN